MLNHKLYFLLLIFLLFLNCENLYSQLTIPGDTSGYTAGQFNVTETGAAVYSIPITISPGTAGMQPSLSLSYNSQGSNGLLGEGWSMQGFSTISRGAKTYAQDGKIKGIALDTSDRFCLDGERLISAHGPYGGSGTDYRTEQNAFIKIISHGIDANGAPIWFEAFTNSGLIMEYGNSPDSRIEAAGTSKILFWLVTQIHDTKGNYIAFTYFENSTTGEYYPLRIDYTGHLNPFSAPYNSIQFFYSSRADSSSKFIKGSSFRSKKILNSIKAYNGTSLVREYNFAYQQGISTNASQLISVTECGTDGHCFTPTTFSWMTDNNLSFNSATSNIIPTTNLNDPNTQIRTGDWNGDGVQDIMDINYNSGVNHFYLNNKLYNFASPVANPISSSAMSHKLVYIADFNGDGKSDIFTYYPFPAADSLYINNGNFSFTSSQPITPSSISSSNGAQIFPMDLNGDGLSDILWYDQTSGENHWFINNGNNTFSLTTNPIAINQLFGGTSIYPGDWNSDGLIDILWFDQSNGNTRFFINNGAFSFTQINNLITPGLISGGSNIDFGDWNGDGVTDLMWYDKTTGNTKWFYNKGDLTFSQASSNISSASLSGANANLIFIDCNSDGISDLLYYDKISGINKWFINKGGLSFNSPLQNLIPTSDISNGTQLMFGGFTTRGLVDLLWYDNSNGTNRWFENNIERAHLINSIIDGHGSQIAINYSPLIDTSYYKKETTAVYPLMDFTGAYHIVSSYQLSNGIGSMNQISYKFEGAKIDLRGRGLRGFTKVHIKDETTGITQNKIYSRDYKFISSPLIHDDAKLSDGTLINETDYTPDVKVFYHDSCHYSFVRQSISTSYELDGSVISTTTTKNDYDDYGNPILSVVDYGDGHRDSTKNDYINDTLNWFLGRLTGSVLYRYSPSQPVFVRKSAFEYDVITGLLNKEITNPDSGNNVKIVKQYSYDQYGNITQDVISAWNGSTIENRTTTTAFDSNGRFTIQFQNALGQTTNKTYDQKLGKVLTETGPNNLTTTYYYDGFGRMIKTVSADSNWVKLDYRKCNGNCPSGSFYFIEKQSSVSPPSIAYYDLLNREIRSQSIGFNGNIIYSDNVYNARGELISSSDPYFSGNTVFNTYHNYDTVGRQIQEILPGNRIKTIIYHGLTTIETNPLNQHHTIVNNALGQMKQSKDEQNNIINYDYDGSGHLIKVTDPSGNITTISYDINGNKIGITDPDMGHVTSVYNGFGELISQTDANGLTTTMQYDLLGRLISRLQPEGNTTWLYDTQSHGIGKLATINGINGYLYTVNYDYLGRVQSEFQNIDGSSYNTSQTYDSLGRIKTVVYPSGFTIKNNYNNFGYLSQVCRASDNFVFWQANTVNAKGQLEQQHLGNGLTTNSYFNPTTSFLDSINTAAGLNHIQNLKYSYNQIGILTQRQNALQNLQETFQYDNLNRLTIANISGGITDTVNYDVLGNIIYKSDVGTYHYGTVNNGPHRITSIDLNGNHCVPSLQYNYQYTSFNKVKQVDQDSSKLIIQYGPDMQRDVQMLYVNNILKRKKIYIGILYEKQIDTTVYKELHYIRANGNVIAVFTNTSSGNSFTQYWHKDHLGSLQAITDSLGHLVEELSYDPWGKRRNPDGTAISDTVSHTFARGFTGHEHYDLFDLVDMNGRMYDPILGRFLTADPNIQFPDNLQSLNRYSYVLNCPLSFSDPSGFSLWTSIRNTFFTVFSLGLNHIDPIQHAANVAAKWTENNWKTLAIVAIGIGVGALTGGAGLSLIGVMLSGAASGFATGMAATLLYGGTFGDAVKAGLKGAAIGAITAAASYGIGAQFGNNHATTFGNAAPKALEEGVVYGGAEVAQGGKFEHGFMSGAFSAASQVGINEIGSGAGRIIASSVAGGTVSELGGGKFANGAVTGAFIRMYNDEQRDSYEDEREENMDNNDKISEHADNEEQREIIKNNGNLITNNVTYQKQYLYTILIPNTIPTAMGGISNQEAYERTLQLNKTYQDDHIMWRHNPNSFLSDHVE